MPAPVNATTTESAVAAGAATPFDERVAALGPDALMRLLRGRHSVRQYRDEPLSPEARAGLEAQVAAENERLGLSMQLCFDDSRAFDGSLAHYGSFRNVRNHLALVGRAAPDLDERCGYAGEKIVLLAQALGLNTCWVALTYDRAASAAHVGSGERHVLCVALGYGQDGGRPHKAKPLERLCRSEARPDGNLPAWFSAGVEAARLAPTALNQQRFRFELAADGTGVRARALPALSCGKVDLGIAKLHFELGANAISHAWRFA